MKCAPKSSLLIISALFDSVDTVFTLTANILEPIQASPSDLLARAQAGDAEAFCELCRPYETRLIRQALALCGENTMAEDLAQDTLVEAWKCLRRYNGRCRLFTWLCAILLNRYRNVLREKRPVPISALNREEENGALHSLGRIADSRWTPDLAAQQTERDAMLRQCIQRLSPKHREVIHLRFFADDSLDGIAAALRCSVGTVKSRLFHALKNLRAIHELMAGHMDPKDCERRP